MVGEAIEIELPDGGVYEIRPGPYGKGVAVVPLHDGADSAPQGRRPRESTLALRRRLQSDAAKDQVAAPQDYVQWLLAKDPDVSVSVARQVVYRERRRTLDA